MQVSQEDGHESQFCVYVFSQGAQLYSRLKCCFRLVMIVGIVGYELGSVWLCAECLSDQYRCSDGRCIMQQQFCDGHIDCSDGADEPPVCCKNAHCH